MIPIGSCLRFKLAWFSLAVWAFPSWCLAGEAGKKTAEPGPELELIRARDLPESLARSSDVRWSGEGTVFIAASRQGTVELRLAADRFELERAFALDDVEWRRSFAMHVAVSPELMAFAPPYFEVVWKTGRKSSEHRSAGELGLEHILDLDAAGGRLLIVGGRRGPDGTYLPGGVFAWLGESRGGELSLDPVYYSAQGPEARNFRHCGSLWVSSGRFLRDGSFVIVPGVDPGIYRYSPQKALLQTWDTGRLGIDGDCELSVESMQDLAKDWTQRHRWLSRRVVVDDVLPLPQGPGLIVRRFKDGQASWELRVLQPDGEDRGFRIPIQSSSIFARLRGDVRGGKIILLRSDLVDDPWPTPPEPALFIFRTPE